MNVRLCLCALLLAGWLSPAHAVEQKLTLQDAIQQAIKANLGLQIERLQPEISRLELTRLRDQYGLVGGVDTSISQNISPTATSFISGGAILNQLRQNYNLFLEQQFASGGNLRLSFNNGILNTNSTQADFNPAISPQISLDINHPLLRNTFNGLRQIDQSENNLLAAAWNLKSEAINTVAEVQDAYWNLVLYRERLRVLTQSLQILENLLVMNQETQKAGFMASIDVLQTEARIAAQKASLLGAQLNVDNTQDQLKQLLNPDADPNLGWDVDLVPADQPTFTPYPATIEASYERALGLRPDYQAQLLQLSNAAISEEIANQNRLPALDFRGSGGLESLDSSYPLSIGKLFSFQTYSLSAGLSLEFPVIGNPYQAQYEQTQVQRQQQTVRVENLRQQMLRDVRQAVRNVSVTGQQVEATRVAKRLAEEQLKAQTEKLNLGLTTNFQVLQFQTDFVSASLEEVNAIVNYIQAVNRLQQLEGSLLEAQQIPWENPSL